ncbi:MAG TPA: hypothetical protein VFO01_14770 [Trebonia sp.]|nr:hypothetical protein [Trebonia sp.]
MAAIARRGHGEGSTYRDAANVDSHSVLVRLAEVLRVDIEELTGSTDRDETLPGLIWRGDFRVPRIRAGPSMRWPQAG